MIQHIKELILFSMFVTGALAIIKGLLILIWNLPELSLTSFKIIVTGFILVFISGLIIKHDDTIE